MGERFIFVTSGSAVRWDRSLLNVPGRCDGHGTEEALARAGNDKGGLCLLADPLRLLPHGSAWIKPVADLH
jgi:hypothetical protein